MFKNIYCSPVIKPVFRGRSCRCPKLGDRFRDAAREHLLEATGWGEVQAGNPA
jgi:hypothetical protein